MVHHVYLQQNAICYNTVSMIFSLVRMLKHKIILSDCTSVIESILQKNQNGQEVKGVFFNYQLFDHELNNYLEKAYSSKYS